MNRTDISPLFLLLNTDHAFSITSWDKLENKEPLVLNTNETELSIFKDLDLDFEAGRKPEQKLRLNVFPDQTKNKILAFFDLSFEGLTALMVFFESQKTHVSLIISNNGKNIAMKRDLKYPSNAGIVLKRDKSEIKYHLESGANLTLWYDETANQWGMYR